MDETEILNVTEVDELEEHLANSNIVYRFRVARAAKNHRALYAEMREVLSAIEGAFGIMTATPAQTIRDHGKYLHDKMREHRARIEALEASTTAWQLRRDELLATIAHISQSTPLDSEVAEALEQRGVLLAEIGTLKSQISSFKDERIELHRAWFGTVGVMTPEMMKQAREEFDVQEVAYAHMNGELTEVRAKIAAIADAQQAAEAADKIAHETAETTARLMFELVNPDAAKDDPRG